MKLNIGILFGGKSGEHEVSIQSARSIFNAIDKSRFAPILIAIDKQGAWRIDTPFAPLFLGEGANIHINPAAAQVLPMPSAGHKGLLTSPHDKNESVEIDVFFPIVHGTFGEDGCLQGLLRMLDAPFVGAGVLGSAVGLDKDVMKRLLRDAGLPNPRFLVFRHHERDTIAYADIVESLGSPVFVKPCNLGSSVGIAKARTEEEFKAAVTDAFLYDTKIIIEEAIAGRELECAVLGNDIPEASVAGEINLHADFYSYKAKYIDADGAGLEIPAQLDEETVRRMGELAVAVFQALECAGMARVDFFLTKSGKLIVNEINTLPGFTSISMYPKLWEASGLPYTELLTRLIELGQDAYAKQNALKRSFDRG